MYKMKCAEMGPCRVCANTQPRLRPVSAEVGAAAAGGAVPWCSLQLFFKNYDYSFFTFHMTTEVGLYFSPLLMFNERTRRDPPLRACRIQARPGNGRPNPGSPGAASRVRGSSRPVGLRSAHRAPQRSSSAGLFAADSAQTH